MTTAEMSAALDALERDVKAAAGWINSERLTGCRLTDDDDIRIVFNDRERMNRKRKDDVEWFASGCKKPFAYTTKAEADFLNGLKRRYGSWTAVKEDMLSLNQLEAYIVGYLAKNEKI